MGASLLTPETLPTSWAVRRFRVHVVLFTVDAVVGAVVLSQWAAVMVVQARNRSRRARGPRPTAETVAREDAPTTFVAPSGAGRTNPDVGTMSEVT